MIKKDVLVMKRPSDATKLVLKKSRKYLVPARDLIKETVKHKMENVFGSSEKI